MHPSSHAMTAVGLDAGRAAAERTKDEDRGNKGKENGSHIIGSVVYL
jgi:hypothetical protein